MRLQRAPRRTQSKGVLSCFFTSRRTCKQGALDPLVVVDVHQHDVFQSVFCHVPGDGEGHLIIMRIRCVEGVINPASGFAGAGDIENSAGAGGIAEFAPVPGVGTR